MTSADYPVLLSVSAARDVFVQLCANRRVESESIRLGCARDRILASDVIASIAIPPFANSAMDGYALRGIDLPTTGARDFKLIGVRLAGTSSSVNVGPGECLRITTGAALPDGADSVVIKENVQLIGDRVRVHAGERSAAHVRRAGEDIVMGSTALRAGQQINPARLGVLASLGLPEIEVARKLRVVLLTTGDELIAPGQSLGPAQIHNSNGYSIGSQLLRMGVQLVLPTRSDAEPWQRHEHADSQLRFMQVRDEPEALRQALRASASVADVVISSGGVSAGEADFLPRLLAETGRIHFWKVKMRPGMPLLCGEMDGALIVGLPGNPVSSLASLLAVIAPGLAAMQGSSEHALARMIYARLETAVSKSHDRTEFMRARLESLPDGSLSVSAIQRQGSGMLGGMAEANALIVLDEATNALAAGSVVPCILIHG